MHELPAAPTAADDRDQFGRPKAALHFGQLLAVTAYWLAITVLWGAFTFSVIPRLVESDGVLGSSSHPLAGLAIGLITTAGRADRDRGAADHGRHQRPHPFAARPSQALHPGRHAAGHPLPHLRRLGVLEREPTGRSWASVIAAAVQQQLRPGPVPGLHPGPRARPRRSASRPGCLGAANIAGNLLGPGLAILFVAVLPTVLGFPAITLGLFVAIGRHRADHHADHGLLRPGSACAPDQLTAAASGRCRPGAPTCWPSVTTSGCWSAACSC